MKNSAYIFVKWDHRKFQLSESLLVSSLVLSVRSQGKIQLKHADIDPTRCRPAAPADFSAESGPWAALPHIDTHRVCMAQHGQEK
jgi:hypothetical protein